MARFLALDELFEGRHFGPEVIVLCVQWCTWRFKTQLPRSGGDDGGSVAFRWLTPPSCAGCTITHRSSNAAGTGSPGRPWPIVARRRDLREDPRQVDGLSRTGRWMAKVGPSIFA